jgi:hypothetical protein
MFQRTRHFAPRFRPWDASEARAAIEENGAGGNGYTLLNLYRRTKDPLWPERARAFAMAAIDQVRGARAAFGRGRYSLWTGDPGLAVYLWHCTTGEPRFPTIGVL